MMRADADRERPRASSRQRRRRDARVDPPARRVPLRPAAGRRRGMRERQRREREDDSDGPPAVRRQPVLRRQPHVRGEGARAGDAVPGPRRRHGCPRHRLRRGHPHVHVHDPRAHRRRRRPGARRIPTATPASPSTRACPTPTSTPTRSPSTACSARCERFLPDEGLLNAAMRGGRRWPARTSRASHAAGRRRDDDVPGLRTPVIWLQNVVVDLLLGLGFDEAFPIFADHVRDRYGPSRASSP